MDQFYFEEGYLDAGYITVIRDSGTIPLESSLTFVSQGEIASTTGYYIPDYIDVGYFSGVTEADASISSSASIDVSVTRIQQSAVAISSESTVDTVNSRIRSTDIALSSSFAIAPNAGAIKTTVVVLDNTMSFAVDVIETSAATATLDAIINLSLQADKFAGFNVDFNAIANTEAAASISADGQAAFAVSSTQITNTNKIVPGNAALSSSFAFSAVPLTVIYLDSTELTASSDISAQPISFVQNDPPAGRPFDLDTTFVTSEASIAYDTVVKKRGSGSIKLTAPGSFDTAQVGTVLKADTNPGTGEFILEGWFNTSDPPNDGIQMVRVINLFELQMNATTVSAYYRPSGGSNTFIGQVANTSYLNKWTHFAIRRESGIIYFELDGTSIASASYSGELFTTGTQLQVAASNRSTFNYDEITLRYGDALVTGLDGPLLNDYNNTIGLYNFEGASTFRDDTVSGPYLFDFVEDLSSVFAVSAIGGEFLYGEADFTVASTVTADATKLDADSANFSVVTSLSATTGFFVDETVALDATATLTANAGEITQFEAALSSEFVSTQTAEKIVVVDSELTTTATFNVSADRIRENESTLATNGGFVVSAIASREYDIDVFVNSALEANIAVIKGSAAEFNVEATIEPVAGPVFTGDTDLTVNTTLQAAFRTVSVNREIYIVPKEHRSINISNERRELTVAEESRTVSLTN